MNSEQTDHFFHVEVSFRNIYIKVLYTLNNTNNILHPKLFQRSIRPTKVALVLINLVSNNKWLILLLFQHSLGTVAPEFCALRWRQATFLAAYQQIIKSCPGIAHNSVEWHTCSFTMIFNIVTVVEKHYRAWWTSDLRVTGISVILLFIWKQKEHNYFDNCSDLSLALMRGQTFWQL